MDKGSDGRKTERHVLMDLIEEVLRSMVRIGGAEGTRVVKSYIPTLEIVL